MSQPSLPSGSRWTFATGTWRCSPQLRAELPCWLLCLGRCELGFGKLCKTATESSQFVERTHFDNATMVEHEDTRRVADRGEPVGDDERDAVPHSQQSFLEHDTDVSPERG